jgi:flagellar motor protein MotB
VRRRPAVSGFVRWPIAAAVLLVFAAGCAENSMTLKGKLDQVQQQQVALARQKDELQNRLSTADVSSQSLNQQLSESQRKAQLLQDELNTVKGQLQSTNDQLARLGADKKATDQRVQALTTSMQRQGSVPITPNNSLLQTLPQFSIPDVQTRRVGDTIRVEIPSERLFQPGNAELTATAPATVIAVANELLRLYPKQIIGIEGHTDPSPTLATQWQNGHQLSTWRAMAVYNVLTTQARVSPSQLFVTGHGGNHPVLSNATVTGKQRNNRIEMVVYPDTVVAR